MSNVSVAIFENESASDGKSYRYFRAKVDKRWHDAKTGQWNSSNSFSSDELLRLQHLIGRAVEFMSSRPSSEVEAAAETPAPRAK
jgi:hypothetical protein